MTPVAASLRIRIISRVCISLPYIVLAIGMAIAPVPGTTAWAQAAVGGEARTYDIPAGGLTAALNRFVFEAGVSLVFEPALAQDLTTQGLRGSYTVESGLTALLQGTGLEAVSRENGKYGLRRIRQLGQESSGVRELSAIAVHADSPAEQSATNYTVRHSRSASKLDLELKETPQSVSVFTEKLVQDMALTNVSEVLEWTPGVTVVENGVPGAGRVQYFARGFAINNFQLDGVMLDGAAFGAQNNNSNRTAVGMQDPFLYERMDIVRGSTGLTTGSGDPSASLNFTRKKPFYERRFQGNVKYGSWNNKRVELDASVPLTESGNWRARLVGTRQEGDSYQDRTTQSGEALYGITELDITPATTLGLGFSHQERSVNGAGPHGTRRTTQYGFYDQDLGRYVLQNSYADLGRSFNSAAQWSYRDFTWRNYFVNLDHVFDNGWRLSGTYNRFLATSDRFYGVIGTRFYLPEYDVASYNTFREKYDNNTSAYDVSLNGDFDLFGRQHDFVLGMNQMKTARIAYGFAPELTFTTIPVVNGPRRNVDSYNYYYQNQWFRTSEWNDGDVALPYLTLQQQDLGFVSWGQPNGTSRQVFRQRGIYFSTRLRPTENLQAILGARYGTGEYAYAQPDSLIPYFGLIYAVTPSSNVYASYTRIEKPQTPTDGKPIGADGKFLDPIRGNSIEAGLKSALFDDKLNLAAAYFTMTQDNVGVMDPAGIMVKDPSNEASGANFPSYKGIDGYRVWGLDLSFAGQLTPEWMVTGGYVYQRQNVPTELEELAASVEDFSESFSFPKHSFKFFTTYQLSPRWTVGGGANWRSSSRTEVAIYDLNGSITDYERQGSYMLVSLMARYHYNRHLTLGMNVNNLFDKWYYTNSNVANYGAPRSVTASLSLSF